ncbi:auxilin-like protein 1 [Pyrus ussuriensis x Pyrus communis]|uniref:Auxilin-like protein 1 n=1 Tax=Pyrus ussuriensis x Pyrus communis TaxID=2448454 RepID=A0A5N5GR63_9ROSA|nr:auxilin-like protein 1 [Pyrus ussuriensis x Pyrus communis]
MDNLSHSRHPNRSSSAKMMNNGGLLAKTLYDDVYGGPPKFGLSSLSPRLEDYSEIFGSFHASRASSIPVLDVPTVDENEVFFDVRSSGFDYSEVFGGFNGLDFAVAYDDLADQSHGGGGDSSDEAWTPAESGSLSEGSDDCGKNQCSNGDPYQSFDGSTDFSMAYHTAHQTGSKDSLNGMTYVTQAHVVPGYTFVLDEVTPSQQTEHENPIFQVADDSKLNMNSNVEVVNQKYLKKTMSHPPNGSSSGQAFGDNLKHERGHGRYGSHHRRPFVTVSDISLRTQPSQLPPPSRPPPLLDGSSGDSGRLSSNSNTIASDGTTGDSSPRFFDVEVDASSSAAISAAAMREAMEKAKVQLKSAKELMQRRKDGFQTCTTSGSKKEMKEKEGMVGKIVDDCDGVKDEGVQGTSVREDGRMKFVVKKERRKSSKTTKEVPEFLEDEILLNVAKHFEQEKHGNGSFKIDDANEWQEETQYFELAAIDESKKAFEQENKEKILVQSGKSHENRHKEKATMEALEQKEEIDKKVKVVIEEEPEEQPRGWEECNARPKVSNEACSRKEHDKKVKVAGKIRENGQHEMSSRMGTLPAEPEKQRDAEKSEKHDIVLEVQEQARKQKVNDKRIRSDKRLKESRGTKSFEQRQEEALKQEEKEIRLKEAFEQAENEKKLKKVLQQEENEMRLKEAALEQVENEKRLKKALELRETEKKLKEAAERENKKKQKEAAQIEEYEKRIKEALEREEYEKRKQDACERKEAEQRIKMAHACEQQYDINGLMKAQDKEGTEGRLNETFGQVRTESTLEEANESEQTGKTVKVAGDWEELNVLNTTNEGTERNENGQTLYMKQEDLRVSGDTCNQDCNQNSQATQLSNKHDKSSETVAATQEVPAHEGNGEKRTEHNNSDTQPEVVRVSMLIDLELKASDASAHHSENGENWFKREDASESLPVDDSVKKASEEIRAEPKASKGELGAFEIDNVLVDEKLKESGMAQQGTQEGNSQVAVEDAYESVPLDIHMKKAGEPGSRFGPPRVEQFNQMDFDHEAKKDLKEVEAASIREENKKEYSTPKLVREFVENKRKTAAAHPAMTELNSQKSSGQFNAGQPPERKEKSLKETVKNGEKENERLKRERELENERLRKVEEEREREREREKDRMAVDRATLEAREWPFLDARDRTESAAIERASAEARQRTMAEARERLEKACAEAREKSLAGMTAMEARLKAERAAVERATAEARERAAEKAMAERAVYEARERVQRSVSDKFYTSSTNIGLRHCSSSSDLPDSTRGSRYPYSSVYGERYEVVEGESAQRCKARLERHARTAERAAKALAEKNTRDLLAQREQAERNRLAETLDAEVRRWSSGKEGNLRALLSTLQYILGADSGWQPVPLTEVITAAAVKRAYRKATLCVHPDKLQQRGASIHQKYICEKVFDLLKEAWNKFNSEER